MEFNACLKKIPCLLFIICLTACGGGGGGKSDVGANPPPSATSSSQPAASSSQAITSSSQPATSISSSSFSTSSTTSTSQSVASSSRSSSSNSPTALVGHIWHSFKDLGNPDGTFVMDPNTGVSISVQDEKWGVPWFDGSRFIHTDYNAEGTSDDTTRLVVRRTSDKAVVMDLLANGYVGHVVPSPLGSDQIMAQLGETIFTPRAVVVWDLGTQKLLFATEESDMVAALSWMPDGSLLRVRPSGTINKIVIGGEEQLIGTVSWPEARVPQAVYVSPDGAKALVQLAALRDTGSVSSVDLWVMNIDGSEMKRFTNNGLIAEAYWSPDSRNVAFVKDTGISCTDFTCAGSCTVWYAPATATDVVAVEASGDAKHFPLTRPDNTVTTLRCPMMGWTL